MRAIVTGADGFVGSYLVKELLGNGYQVLAIDLSPKPHRLPNDDNLCYRSLSIENITVLDKDVDVGYYDFFFHFAWRGSAGAERDDEDIQLRNALETSKCLREAAKLGIKRFIMSGTIMEFETRDVVYQGESEPALSYIYGAGKISSHLICKPIANALGIELVWAYITNSYGPGETAPRLLNSIIKNVIEKKPLSFTSGIQNYDFIYVTDVAKAFRLIAEKGKKNKGYLIGSGHAKPLKEFICEALDVLHSKDSAKFGAINYTGAMTSLEDFSIKDIENDCGFYPSVTFKEGIKNTYEHMINSCCSDNVDFPKRIDVPSIVTGADGFIGSHLVASLLKKGMKVLAIDLTKEPQHLDITNPNLLYINTSIDKIDNLDTMVAKGQFLCFYHCAWKASAGFGRNDPDVQLENVSLTAKCIKEAAKLGCKKFVFLSTIGELEANQITYISGSEPDPHYVYGVCKAAAHGICKSLASSIGISLNCVYLTNVYGPGETSPKFINWLMDKTVRKEKVELTSCSQLYDFVHINDVVSGLILVGMYGQANKEYILGSGEPRPLKEFLLDFSNNIPDPTTFVFGLIPYTGAETPRCCFDISSAIIDLGYHPEVKWTASNGILETYLWRRKQIKNGSI